MMTNMKIALLFLAATLAPAAAFCPSTRSVAFVARSATTTALQATAAEEYLNQLLQEWKQLEKQVDELKNNKDDMAAADLAEEMLMKALATARAKRDVENEHVDAATNTYNQAVAEELECEASIHALEDEADAAEGQASMVESVDAGYEDQERVRDFSVAHAARHEEVDFMAMCKNAEEVARRAQVEMTDAKSNLKQLAKSERELKAALKELHDAKNEMRRKQWAEYHDEAVKPDFGWVEERGQARKTDSEWAGDGETALKPDFGWVEKHGEAQKPDLEWGETETKPGFDWAGN